MSQENVKFQNRGDQKPPLDLLPTPMLGNCVSFEQQNTSSNWLPRKLKASIV